MTFNTKAEPFLRLTVNGETPAKKNSKVFNTKTHRLFPSRRYREWHDSAVVQVNNQFALETINFPVFIILTFYHSDRRRRDSDNGVSSIFDLLVDCRVLSDDDYHIIPGYFVSNVFLGKSPDSPKCTVEFFEPLTVMCENSGH